MAYENGKVRWKMMNQRAHLPGLASMPTMRPFWRRSRTEAGFEKVRRWIDERAFRAQLDRLCHLAQDKAAQGIGLVSPAV
jgi:hypothetical protein